ncbi:MAG: glycosyltransferase family 2 protein [Planctomycetota bacterium]
MPLETSEPSASAAKCKASPLPIDPRVEECRAEFEPARPPAEGGGWPEPGSVAVSLLVPVLNEERNLPGCLRRMRWASEIVVVDSDASHDRTVPIAQAFGADAYRFCYDRETGWPKKKNWGLENVPWKNEWVLILDADEYMTPELAREIRDAVEGRWKPSGKPSAAGCGDGFWINRKFMFMGRWIRGCGYYPSWNVRLLRHGKGRYERLGTLGDTGSGDNEVHEHILLDAGPAGYLRNDFLHYAYPDLSVWTEKHNRYSTWEAHAELEGAKGSVHASPLGSPIERRRWLKKASRGLPFRPTLRFLYAYFLQRGFLDGYPGYVMCRLLGWYELMSIAKRQDMKIKAARGDEMPT